jgi:Fur family transcriptional regulator, ferric uptake regulator
MMRLRITRKMEPVDHFRGFLKKNGLAFTSARAAILKGIVASRGHFDADALHEQLKRVGESLSCATVYRTLPLFVQSGIIKETLRSKGRARYEPAWGREHHDHLECVACGRIIEFRDDELERLQDKVCQRHSFRPVEHRLGIRGYCSECRKKGT